MSIFCKRVNTSRFKVCNKLILHVSQQNPFCVRKYYVWRAVLLFIWSEKKYYTITLTYLYNHYRDNSNYELKLS